MFGKGKEQKTKTKEKRKQERRRYRLNNNKQESKKGVSKHPSYRNVRTEERNRKCIRQSTGCSLPMGRKMDVFIG